MIRVMEEIMVEYGLKLNHNKPKYTNVHHPIEYTENEINEWLGIKLLLDLLWKYEAEYRIQKE